MKSKYNTAFVVVSGPDPNNEYGTKENVARFKILFKNGDLFHIDGNIFNSEEEFIKIPDMFLFIRKLASKYENILFYYTGYGETTRTDDIPGFKFQRRYTISEIKEFCEKWGFLLSITIFDCCSNKPHESVISQNSLFPLFDHIIRSFSVDQLTHLMNKRGHFTVTASKNKKLSNALPNIGGIFSCIYWHFIYKNCDFEHVFLESVVSTNTVYEQNNIENSFCSIQGFLISIAYLEQLELSMDQFKVIDFSIPDSMDEHRINFFLS